MNLFPYPPRTHQIEAVNLISTVAQDGGHLVLEAPTGTGKTIVLLAGALQAALQTDRRILYLTRTHSQQEQTLRELNAIRTHTRKPLTALALQGRHHLCLLLEDSKDPEWVDSSTEELGHFCRNAKQLSLEEPANPKSCSYYSKLQEMTDEDLLEPLREGPSAEAFKSLGRAGGFCSYEATKRLLPHAHVVVAPYVFAFHPTLRSRLFQWWQTDPSQVILVVDEAHNLPAFLRELHSPRLGEDTLRKALLESQEQGDPLIGPNLTTRMVLDAFQEVFFQIVQEYALEEDGYVPPFEVEAHLLSRFQVTTQGLLKILDQLAKWGEFVKERRRMLGKIPRSALSRMAEFLHQWISGDEESFVKIVIKTPRPYLELFCVDATLGGPMLEPFHATIHASGTLHPLSEYRDTLGLGESARLEQFPTPFPSKNLKTLVIQGLTTRYERLKKDPALVDRLQESVRLLVQKSQRKTALFFPSHQLLQEFLEVGVLDAHHDLLVEEPRVHQEQLMKLVERHRSPNQPTLLVGVLGGRLSEGMNFPGRELEALLLVGVPFPKPTARQRSLFRYYEARQGRGWDYAVKAPALRSIRQAMGRLIRGPSDRGIAILVDERAAPLLQEFGIEIELVSLEQALERYESWQLQASTI